MTKALAAAAVLFVTLVPARAQSLVTVVIQTEIGSIEVELEAMRARDTVANFLRYVDGGLYDGGRFHRSVTMSNQLRDDVRIEVIQGGRSPERAKSEKGFGPIALERTSATGLEHTDGVISMARGTTPDSAASDFFICVGDQPALDFAGKRAADGQGFAAFGRVVRGMDVVRKIHAMPAPKERLDPPVTIIRISRK